MTSGAILSLPVRARRLYHDRIGKQSWMLCIKHGPMFQTTPETAGQLHAKGEKCSACAKEVADANKP